MSKIIKDKEIEEEIKFEALEIDKIWRYISTILYSHKQLIEIILQLKMIQNLKILKMTQEVRDNKGNI